MGRKERVQTRGRDPTSGGAGGIARGHRPIVDNAQPEAGAREEAPPLSMGSSGEYCTLEGVE